MPIVTGFAHDIDVQNRSLDAVLAELAVRQQGVVAYWQLIELGFGRGAIEHRIATKRLQSDPPGRVCSRSRPRQPRWIAHGSGVDVRVRGGPESLERARAAGDHSARALRAAGDSAGVQAGESGRGNRAPDA